MCLYLASTSARQGTPSPTKMKPRLGPAATPGAAPSSSRRVPSSRTNTTPSRFPSKSRLPPLISPSKPTQPAFPHSSSVFRAPDSKMPLPAYPRPMRPDEVLMSENGSPVANPFARERALNSDQRADTKAPADCRPASTISEPGNASARNSSLDKNVKSESVEHAFVSIRTSTGESVSFDPLLTSPRASFHSNLASAH